MDAGLVAVDPGARNEVVQAGFDTETALRDAMGFPRFTQPAAVNRELSLLSQAPVRSGVPCKEASGRTLEFDTTLNVAFVDHRSGCMSWRSGVAVRSAIKVVLPMQLRVSTSLAVAVPG